MLRRKWLRNWSPVPFGGVLFADVADRPKLTKCEFQRSPVPFGGVLFADCKTVYRINGVRATKVTSAFRRSAVRGLARSFVRVLCQCVGVTSAFRRSAVRGHRKTV